MAFPQTATARPATARPATVPDNAMTGTLLRGRVYFFGGKEFHVNKPIQIDEDLAQQLETIEFKTADRQGNEIIHPMFRIDRPARKTAARSSVPASGRAALVGAPVAPRRLKK